MPKNHARKQALADLKTELSIKHSCAIALLDHPDPDDRDTLEQYLAEYIDINTYREALDYLRQQQNDPRNQVMCDRCGWTGGMACPECSGCGCDYSCTGWRHAEYAEEDPDTDSWGCQECGAGGGNDPYGECCCYDYDDEEENAVAVA
ncbi:hypothetical protein EDD99_8113 [Streptomyces sp. 846.5]|nr:hypothetical protein [Streptomyces sp. 846.5]TDT93304.1 hypothetical protein EDD99_8113 [Streptomyces sp. 846.5]